VSHPIFVQGFHMFSTVPENEACKNGVFFEQGLGGS
jgi:hypothetical protein